MSFIHWFYCCLTRKSIHYLLVDTMGFDSLRVIFFSFERHIRFDTPAVAIPEGFNAYDYSRVAHERFSFIHSASELEKV